jgi:hypothetical protein
MLPEMEDVLWLKSLVQNLRQVPGQPDPMLRLWLGPPLSRCFIGAAPDGVAQPPPQGQVQSLYSRRLLPF